MIKKNWKTIILIITLIILCTSIGVVYADYVLNANQVTYNKAGNTIAVNTALDELYEIAKNAGIDTGIDRTVETNLGYTGNTKASDLVPGDHINYYYANGTSPIECICLYNDSTRGIQVVSADTVGSNITLGKTDPKLPSSLASASDLKKATWSYNNAVYTLNEYAMTYVPNGGMALDGRCVGSCPLIGQKNKSEESPYMIASNYPTEHEENWMTSEGWYNKFKLADTEYVTDDNTMRNLNNIHNIIGKSYWLASRYVNAGDDVVIFGVRDEKSDGDVGYEFLFDVFNGGNNLSYSKELAFRPCFYLKSNILVEKL